MTDARRRLTEGEAAARVVYLRTAWTSEQLAREVVRLEQGDRPRADSLSVFVFVYDGKWNGVVDTPEFVVERHGATPGEVIDKVHRWACDRGVLVHVEFAQPLGTSTS